MIWVGIGLGALYWVLESAMHVLVFHEDNLVEAILTPNPHELWIRLLVVSILIAFGVYTHFIIAERKRAEEALQESLERLEEIVEQRTKELQESELWMRSMFNSLEEAVFVVTPDRMLVNMNAAAQGMFGYFKDELVDLSADVLHVDHEHYLEFGRRIREAFDKGKTANFQFELERKNGDIFPTEHTVSLLKNDVGEPIGIISVVRDMTERKEMEEQLVRKEHLAILGQLAGGVGHELRNPLGVISNAVYYLQTILPDADETTKEYLEMIASEVGNSEKIVSDLLDLSRAKPAERQEIAVSDLVARLLEKQPPPEKVKVTTKIASDLPPVFVDSRQIGQVLVNLVINAYQAMPEGGRLTIKARAEKGQVYLSITDTGCGISQENMERLFEPLFTTKAKGIGLGLAVSKNLLEANGGSIEVESKEGKGSTFTVILPTKEAQA